MATFKVGVRRVNLIVLELVAQVIRVKAVNSIVTSSQAVSAVAEAVAIFDIVTGLAAPVAHLAVILAPSMYGMVADGDLSSSPSLALKIGGLVHVAINVMAYMGNGIGGSKSLQASVHGKSFSL